MLRIDGDPYGCCDGFSRRNFMAIGATGLAGLGLSDLYRLDAQQGKRHSRKALINIHLGGGPSHQDMWDLKPDAPSGIRGEFNPIPTNVPGMEICELFPKLARRADKFALIRGLVGSVNEHSSRTAMSGYGRKNLEAVGGRPSGGSVIARLNRSSENPAPPFVSLMGKVSPGYLGPSYQPYIPDSRGRQNLSLATIDGNRLKDRTELLASLDRIRRDIDSSGDMEALDSFTQRAVEVVTSGRMAKALDLKDEHADTIRKYVGPDTGRYRSNKDFLMARRLVEAGVRCIAMKWGGWDTHGDNFKKLREQLPALDMGLSALLDDLYDHDMLQDVTIVMWGEFGRTPKINTKGGRDHWPRVSAAFVAGGSMKTGQVIGASDKDAADAASPVHLHQVHSTLYHNMGIDVKNTQFVDPAGRPQYLLDIREPIRQLL